MLDVNTQSNVWLKEGAHDKSVLDCFFSPDDGRLLSCDETNHKVIIIKPAFTMFNLLSRCGLLPMETSCHANQTVPILEPCLVYFLMIVLKLLQLPLDTYW